MKFWQAFTVICLVGAALWRRNHQTTTIIVVTPHGGEASVPDWDTDFLGRVGNAAPSYNILVFMRSWRGAEGGSAAFNPLNTTQPMDGDSCYNHNAEGKCLVRNYTSYEQGMLATVKTITNGSYPHILHGLITNNVEEALDDAELGTWGTGRGAVARKYRELQAASPTPNAVSKVRQQLVAEALALLGIPYISGGRTQVGGDCSGTMQYIFKTVVARDIGATTYSQQDEAVSPLRPIPYQRLQPGDLWYGQYSDDQHVGMVADVNGDGKWDLINNGGLEGDMHVDYDFLATAYFNEHTIGYRTLFDQ